jgi:hypothetical protein
MALPSSRLTDLLSRSEKTPAGLVAALSANGCLTPETVQAPTRLVALLAATLAEAGARPIMPGPSTQDLLVWALLDSTFLSPSGRQWAHSSPES